MEYPKVGIGVLVWKGGKIIIGQRGDSHGSGTWSVPGGHLEQGESFEDCAKREVFEETGLKIKNVRPLAVTNDLFKSENKHYVTIWLESDWAAGKETVKEPRRMRGWQWRTLSNLPAPLFEPWRQLKKSRPDLFKRTSSS